MNIEDHSHLEERIGNALIARAAIEKYIDERDKLWHELSYRPLGPFAESAPSAVSSISSEEIAHLDARNQYVEVVIKSKVAAALFLREHIGLEKLRVNVCNTFIARVRLELRGTDTKPRIDPLAEWHRLPACSSKDHSQDGYSVQKQ